MTNTVRAGSFLFTVLKPGLPDDRFCAILYCHDSAGFFIVGRSPWQKTGRATIVGPTHRPGERQVYCELVTCRPTYGSSFTTRLVTATGLSVRDTEIDPHVAAILASEPLDRFHPHLQIAIWLAARQNITLENVNESYADNPFSEEDWNRAVALEERTRP